MQIDFSFQHHVHTGSGAHPLSYAVGTGRSWREADHSPPSSFEIKNALSYTSSSQCVFMRWYLVKHRDNFTSVWSTFHVRLLCS